MKFFFPALAILGFSIPLFAQTTEVVLAESFENEEVLKTRLTGGKWRLEPNAFGKALLVENDNPAGDNKIYIRLPSEKIKGERIAISASVRGVGLSEKPKPWNGVKLMLEYELDDGKKDYPAARFGTGTFDWTNGNFIVKLPANLKTASIVVGVELVSGKAGFDDLQVKILRSGDTGVWTNPSPYWKGYAVSRLRGAMTHNFYNTKESDFENLGKTWNANLIRWQLGGTKYEKEGLALPDYDKILTDELDALDKILPHCRKYGLQVCLDLHSLSRSQFSSPANQEKLTAVWKKIAARYKGNPVIWAYDLANEPNESDWKEGALLWNDLAEKVALAIREVDPVKTIVVEPAEWGTHSALANLRPIKTSNVVYSVHFYAPHPYTHQKFLDYLPDTLTYPGEMSGKKWDLGEIEKEFAPVIAFQKKYQVQIYIGEFSAVRWAPGAEAWLKDAITVFEKYGWDWTYHAHREWHGWSVEHDETFWDKSKGQPPNATAMTGREKLLLEWFAKNQKPEWAGK